jgi:hypothetical protein
MDMDMLLFEAALLVIVGTVLLVICRVSGYPAHAC